MVLEKYPSPVTAVSTASGTEFLITTPGFLTKDLNTFSNKIPSVYLHIYAEYTQSNVQVQIQQQFYFKPNHRMDNNITLEVNFTHPKDLYIEPKYYPEPGPGVIPVNYILSSWPVNIMVSIHEGNKGQETFRAVPVSGWGTKYHAVTLGSRYSLVLLTSEEPNTVTIVFGSNQLDFSYNHSSVIIKNGESIKLQIFRFKPYAVTSCHIKGCKGSLTGSVVTGEKPFGLVTGNCRSPNDQMSCQPAQRYVENYIVEMMLPQESYGREFILFKEHTDSIEGFTLVLAGSPNTEVHTYLDAYPTGEKIVPKYLTNINDWLKLYEYVAYINSSKGVLVMYIMGTEEEDGGPSLLLIVPMELYYFKYMVMSPSFNTSTLDFVAFVIHEDNRNYTLIENHNPDISVPDIGRRKNLFMTLRVRGHMKWKYVISELHQRSKFVVLSTRSTFGCYQYGIGKFTSYMHPAGFISSPINKLVQSCDQTRVRMTAHDLTDNDCDGRIDEEMANGVDDDNDKDIDEDLNIFSDVDTYDGVIQASPRPIIILPKTTTTVTTTTTKPSTTTATPTVTSTTPTTTTSRPTTQAVANTGANNNTADNRFLVRGHWKEWRCSRDCHDPTLHRIRSCVDHKMSLYPNCDQETKLGQCYIGVQCPDDCPMHFWGSGCVQSCINCDDSCDKFNGSCLSCNPGYRNPAQSCNEACSANYYGKNCQGNCLEKCGTDCLERINGACIEEIAVWKNGLLAFVIIAVVTIVAIFATKKFTKIEEEPLYLIVTPTQSDTKVDVRSKKSSSAVSVHANRSSRSKRSKQSGTSLRTHSYRSLTQSL
ncbi:properdin [Biomphalaria pfeifferi]|uniref:Properdin n=1 Tax=Biomphalaria pfeifferi TaxID=112525 RepID=A0AAD8BM52_BIOPF|nr:properdin [Biomphalaria pfeifferi]